MMGYAIGFELIKGYRRTNTLSVLESLKIPSKKILDDNHFLHE